MQNGVVYQAALLELATKEIAGGSLDSLPTPTVCNDSMYYDKSPNKDKRHSKGLATEIIDREMLPTPTTMDHLDQRSPEALKRQMEGPRKGRKSLSNLREAVNPRTQEIFNSLLPTPTASDIEGGVAKDVQYKNGSFYRVNKEGVRWGVKLRDAVSIITDGEIQSTDSIPIGNDMCLNPFFVEEMMGYPIGWTDLKH